MFQIKCGDSLQLMERIPSGSISLLLGDMPYGTTNAEFDRPINRKTRGSKSVVDLPQFWEQVHRVVKPTGAVVLFSSQPFTSVLITSNYQHFKYTWIWIKNRCGNAVAVRYQPMKIFEEICVFSQGGANTNAKMPMAYYPQDVVNVGAPKYRSSEVVQQGVYRYNSLTAGNYISAGSNFPTAVLQYPVPSGKNRVFSTQKPVALLRYLIKTYSKPGEIVLDPFLGSGSTGVAAAHTNRRFVGIEIDPQIYQLAHERLEKFLEKKVKK